MGSVVLSEPNIMIVADLFQAINGAVLSSLVKVPEWMCKFLTERQKSSCFISKYGLACPRAPTSRDYALELLDGQENKLLAKNYKCCVSDRLK